MSESDITNPLLVAASRLGCRLWRQNTGRGWVGEMARGPGHFILGPGDVVIRKARPLIAGLCVGSSDTIGLRPVTITPDMVGQTIAQFVALEIKTENVRLTKEQRGFLAMVRSLGGIGEEVRSVESGVSILNENAPQPGGAAGR